MTRQRKPKGKRRVELVVLPWPEERLALLRKLGAAFGASDLVSAARKRGLSLAGRRARLALFRDRLEAVKAAADGIRLDVPTVWDGGDFWMEGGPEGVAFGRIIRRRPLLEIDCETVEGFEAMAEAEASAIEAEAKGGERTD